MTVARRTGWYLLSSLGVPVIGLATLPLFTTKLGPEEFGAFALGTALAGTVSATAVSFSMVSLPAELSRVEAEERRPFMTAVVMLTLLVALVCAAVLFAGYGFAARYFDLGWLGFEALALLVVGALLNSLWGICIEMLTIDGHAKRYAVTTVIQAIGNVVGVSAALFVFGHVRDALFWGFALSALLGAVSAARILLPMMALKDAGAWMQRARRGSRAAVISSLGENGKQVAERAYVSALLGVAPLGFLAHAQYYKNAAMVAINALSRGVLPTAMEEAREEKPSFAVTRRLWTLVQAFALCAALGFALLGQEVIGLLTHGKFVEATAYTVALLTILLVQTAGKPHMTLLMARGHGHVYAHLSTASLVVALVWLVVSVPYIGVWGVISSFFVQILLHRVGVYVAANRVVPVPFADGWVLVGLVMIGAAMLMSEAALVLRVAVLLALYAVILWQLKRAFRMMRGQVRA